MRSKSKKKREQMKRRIKHRAMKKALKVRVAELKKKKKAG